MARITKSLEQILDDVDQETAALILKLTIEDAESDSASTNTPVDTNFRSAKALWSQDLKEYQATHNLVIETAAPAPAERPATADSNASDSSSGGSYSTAADDLVSTRSPPDEKQRKNVWAILKDRLRSLSTALRLTSPSAPSLPSTPTPSAPSTVPCDPVTVAPHQVVLLFNCIICQDRSTADGCWRVPCEHYYCDGCLNDLFRVAMNDEQAYPPRCCRQTVQFEDVKRFLNSDLAREFAAKKEELDDAKPTYCHVPTCSTYIGEGSKGVEIATCPECAARTCITCKNAAHEGDCAQDETVEETMRLAESQGWKRCPQCERIVELRVGCNHMTCLCRAEFCYVCRAIPWKTCACPQFDEERLIERAQEIVERDGQGNAAAVVAGLRQHHECVNDDHDYEQVYGGSECETCGDYLRVFIYRCSRCHHQSCERCMLQRS